jgi:muramidase (phage lysozyme)
MAERKKKTEDADKQRAIHDAYTGASAGFDEGVKQGLIPAAESPTYIKWYKATQGDLRGRELADEFSLAHQNWAGRNSGDPESFKQFVGGFLKERIGDINDPEVLAGLNPHIESIYQNGYSVFTEERSASLKKDALSIVGASVMDEVDRAEKAGKASGGIDYEGLWGAINAQRDEALKRHTELEADPFFVDSIILQAEVSNNEELLALLDRKWPGKDHAISSDPDVRKKINAAKDRITSGLAAAATSNREAEERREKALHNDTVAAELKKMADDPNYQVPEETLKVLGRRDPEFRTKIAGYRKQLADKSIPEDDSALLQVYADIDAGAGKDYVIGKMRQGVIWDPATFTKALDRVDQVTKASGQGGVFDSPTYKDVVKRITNAAGYGEYDPDGNKGLDDDALQALKDYRTAILAWEKAHPDEVLDFIKREEASHKIGQMIIGRIQVEEVGGGGLYVGDPKQPAPGQPPTGQPGMPQEAAPAAPAGQTQYRSEEHRQAVQSLSSKYGISEQEAAAKVEQYLLQDDQQPIASELLADGAEVGLEPGLLKRAAKDLTKPLDGSSPGPMENFWNWITGSSPASPQQNAEEPVPVDVPDAAHIPDNDKETFGIDLPGSGPGPVQSLWNRITGEDGEPSGPPDVRGAVDDDTRTRLTSLLQNPPMLADGSSTAGNTPVAPLLDLIGNTEGTDRRNGYNETLGYGKFTGGDVQLTGMTLDQIDQLQTKMLSHPDNSWNSSALGRYQIIRTTMRGLRKELGLPGDELFDESMQDRLAMHLLERRGLSQWKAGSLSDEQFMRGLSAEWASLPQASGKGTYKGQRVGVSSQGLRGVLGKVRSGEGVQVASLDPSIGLPSEVPQAYSKIPSKDDRGEDQIAKFMEWNPDPIGNHEENLGKLQPTMQSVIRRAQEIGGVRFVIGSGVRDANMQKKAVEWGWSKTEDSDHLDGSSVDLWPIDQEGSVVFDKKQQALIVKAMKQAAREMGVKLDIGADWKSFKDLPHFALK